MLAAGARDIGAARLDRPARPERIPARVAVEPGLLLDVGHHGAHVAVPGLGGHPEDVATAGIAAMRTERDAALERAARAGEA